MGEISLKLTAQEVRLLRKCAKWNSTDISTVVQYAVLKKIEAEYGINLFNASSNKERNGEKLTI